MGQRLYTSSDSISDIWITKKNERKEERGGEREGKKKKHCWLLVKKQKNKNKTKTKTKLSKRYNELLLNPMLTFKDALYCHQ